MPDNLATTHQFFCNNDTIRRFWISAAIATLSISIAAFSYDLLLAVNASDEVSSSFSKIYWLINDNDFVMDKKDKGNNKFLETDRQLEKQAQKADELTKKLELERKANENLRKWAKEKLSDDAEEQ